MNDCTPGRSFGRRLQPATLKPSARSLLRGVAAELAQAEDADGAVRGEVLLHAPPLPRALLRAVAIEVAMPVEHMREHRLRHRRDHSRIDQPRERHAARVGRVGEQLFHAHPERLRSAARTSELLKGSRGRRRDERDLHRLVGHRDELILRQRVPQERQPDLGFLGLRCEKNLHARW